MRVQYSPFIVTAVSVIYCPAIYKKLHFSLVMITFASSQKIIVLFFSKNQVPYFLLHVLIYSSVPVGVNGANGQLVEEHVAEVARAEFDHACPEQEVLMVVLANTCKLENARLRQAFCSTVI